MSLFNRLMKRIAKRRKRALAKITDDIDIGQLSELGCVFFAATCAEHATGFYEGESGVLRQALNRVELGMIRSAIELASRKPLDTCELQGWTSEAASRAKQVDALARGEYVSTFSPHDADGWRCRGYRKAETLQWKDLPASEQLARLARGLIATSAYHALQSAMTVYKRGSYLSPTVRQSVSASAASALECLLRVGEIAACSPDSENKWLSRVAPRLRRDYFRIRDLSQDYTGHGFPEAFADVASENGDSKTLSFSLEESLDRFETTCTGLTSLLGDKQCNYAALKRTAEKSILAKWFNNAGADDSLWDKIGCVLSAPGTSPDVEMTRMLIGLHLTSRDDKPPPTKELVPIAIFLFCHYLTHPKFPPQLDVQGRSLNRYAQAYELLPIQDIALAIFVEAHGSNWAEAKEAIARLSGFPKFFPHGCRLDETSYPMSQIITRAMLSEDIFAQWEKRLDEGQ